MSASRASNTAETIFPVSMPAPECHAHWTPGSELLPLNCEHASAVLQGHRCQGSRPRSVPGMSCMCVQHCACCGAGEALGTLL